MKKIITLFSLLGLPAAAALSQSVPTAYSMSQHDLRGTARFMSMGGAFGALGGDLSTLTQNPGGIGIYRSNEIGLTLDIDALQNKCESQGFSQDNKHTRFNLNNIGGVFTLRLNNNVMPNINFGFTYNKVASFQRRLEGQIPNLGTSMSNYIAGISNSYGLTAADVETTNSYDPYNPPVGSTTVPWLAIMGYDAMLTNPVELRDGTQWYGQYGDGTTGRGSFRSEEKGSVDEYNIALGGNINNMVFWGMDFGITSIDYRIRSIWGEALDNAYVYDPNLNSEVRCTSDWTMHDNYKVNGTGFNFKLGVIVKPIQELRLGLAFHTPTYYNIEETYYDSHIDFNYPFKMDYHSVYANDGYSVGNTYTFRTPWRVIASVAGVIGNNLIISADYEWASTSGMRYGEDDGYGYYDPWYDWDDPWSDWGGWYGSPKSRADGVAYESATSYANRKIKEIYKNTNTLRLGLEYRVIPSVSLRLGYCYQSSPVKGAVKDGDVEVPGTGLMTNYTLDDDANFVTCGVGYKHKGFYVDFAYVYKHMAAEYFPFSPDPEALSTAVKSKVNFNDSHIALSVGYKF